MGNRASPGVTTLQQAPKIPICRGTDPQQYQVDGVKQIIHGGTTSCTAFAKAKIGHLKASMDATVRYGQHSVSVFAFNV